MNSCQQTFLVLIYNDVQLYAPISAFINIDCTYQAVLPVWVKT